MPIKVPGNPKLMDRAPGIHENFGVPETDGLPISRRPCLLKTRNIMPKPLPVAVLSSSAALGPVVSARRKAQALRINDAASLLGVSVDLMSRLENGQGTVRLDEAMSVLDGLGLTLLVLPNEHAWVRAALVPDETPTGSQSS